MNTHLLPLLVALGALCSVAVPAQDADEDPMAAMAELAKPGPEHERLQVFLGEWTTRTKAWYDPAQPPAESGGSATYASVLGGRFVRADYRGDMMGMPFTGELTLGYDKARKQYVSTWCDTLSTALEVSRGSCSEDGKVFTLTGETYDPSLKTLAPSKHVTTVVSADSFRFEFFMQYDGKWVKSFEILYTRKKKAK